ncbi:MAG TPA: hypothetical protein VFS24_16760 [Steroidobacteraceae bacterium]|nr:hypothetical protein [Steroidobacteraceae bacterium]
MDLPLSDLVYSPLLICVSAGPGAPLGRLPTMSALNQLRISWSNRNTVAGG